MYAIIELQGHQYIVKQGDSITVDQVGKEPGETLDISNVLAVFDEDGKDVKVGTPFVSKAKVTLKVVENKRGEKIHVLKFKRKTRYERHIGFRPELSVLHVEKLSA